MRQNFVCTETSPPVYRTNITLCVLSLNHNNITGWWKQAWSRLMNRNLECVVWNKTSACPACSQPQNMQNLKPDTKRYSQSHPVCHWMHLTLDCERTGRVFCVQIMWDDRASRGLSAQCVSAARRWQTCRLCGLPPLSQSVITETDRAALAWTLSHSTCVFPACLSHCSSLVSESLWIRLKSRSKYSIDKWNFI